MSQLVVANFAGGLDARKFFLSLPPGTLTSIINAHITSGAEIEKRKAFIPNAAGTPSNCYGALATNTNIMVFGSRDVSWQLTQGQADGLGNVLIEGTIGASVAVPNAGDSITIANCSIPSLDGTLTVVSSASGGGIFAVTASGSTSPLVPQTNIIGTVSVNFPSPLQFQQLLHPDGVTQMTGVVWAELYEGNAYVSALFADGYQYVYYNGAIVEDFISGLVTAFQQTPEEIAQEAVALVNDTANSSLQPAYTATEASNPGFLSLNVVGIPGGASSAYAYLSPNGSFTNAANSDTVTIGSQVYTFVTAVGSPSAGEIQVLIGSSVDVSFYNLTQSINGGTGSGTLYAYGSGAAANTQVNALWIPFAGSHEVKVTAKATGAEGQAIALGASQVYLIWNDNLGNFPLSNLMYGYPSTAATGSISGSTAFTNGQTVTVGTTVYTLTTGTPAANQNQVKVQSTQALTMTMLATAINGGTNSGNISTGTVANASATASASSTTLALTAIGLGTAGNSIALATTNNSLTVTAFSGGYTTDVGVASIYYDNSTQLCGSVSYTQGSISAFASAIASAINAFGASGFSAIAVGSQVNVTPPTPPIPGTDSLQVFVYGALAINVPALQAQFNTFSIPTVTGGTPYTVDMETTLEPGSTGGFSDILQNTGSATVPGVPAAGSFSVTAGTQNAQATATLTGSGSQNVSNGDTVTIGGTVYTFVTTLSAEAANQIQIAGSGNSDTSFQNLIYAINGNGATGSNYSQSTTTNTQVTAGALTSHAFVVTSIVGGTVGNSIGVSSSSTVNTSPLYPSNNPWGAAVTALSGGGPDTNQISQITIGTTITLLTSAVPFEVTASYTAAQVAAAINANSATTGWSASANNNTVTLFSPSANPNAFNQLPVVVMAAGDVCIDTCFFTVASATGGSGEITSITIGGSANLLTGGTAIEYQGSGHSGETLAQFCTRGAVAVNATTSANGYIACAVGTNIYLSAAVSSSSNPTGQVVVTTSGTISLAGGTASALAVSLSAYTVTLSGEDRSTGGPDTATATGGNPPYTYLWAYAGTSQSVVTASNPTGVTTSFSARLGTAVIEPWTCTVKDSSTPPNVVTSQIVNIYVPGAP